MSEVDIMDPTKLRLEGTFEAQVHTLLMHVRLTRSEVENLQQLINDVQNTLDFAWPDCRVYTFGSIVTGLGIATSDVDCYVSLPEWVNLKGNLVFEAKCYLRSQPLLFAELFAIPMAKVPILKCLHIPTNRYCDINFTSRAGVENSQLLAYLLHADRSALPLAVLIKYWSKVHNLTGTNLMPNYALTMLVIFYLQHLKMIPSVHFLQQRVPLKMINNWNTAFDDTYQIANDENKNRLTLYQLLGGFFEYYSNFDFAKQIVSTYLGRPIEKECFKQLDTVPEPTFDLYKYNVSKKICPELRINTFMCVQDPFELARNCSMAVHARLFQVVLKYFKRSAQLFYDKPSDQYLKAILTIPHIKEDDNVIKNSQNRIHQHPNKIMKPKQKTLKGVEFKFKGQIRKMYRQFQQKVHNKKNS